MNNDVVKKAVYDRLIVKINVISKFVLETRYDTDKSDLEKKIVMQTRNS